jgi:putative phage-type endonuclease
VTTLTTLPLPPAHSPEWHALRLPYVGASDCAALVGQHRYKTIASLAEEKLAPAKTEEEDDPTDAMRAGQVFEAGLGKWWEDDMDFAIERPGVMFVDEHSRIASNPDFIVTATGQPLDCKVIFTAEGRIPAYIDWQVQAQVLTTGAAYGHLSVLWVDEGAITYRSYVVPRDDDAIARLTEAAEQFWSYVDDGCIPPDPHPRPAGGQTVALGDNEAGLLLALIEHRDAERFHAKKAQELRATLHGLLNTGLLVPGDRMAVTDLEGKPLAKVRCQAGRAGLDAAALRRDHPDLAGAYQRNGEPFTVLTGAEK